MTLSSDLLAILNPLASGGAWRARAGQGVVAPYIVYAFAGSNVENVLDGSPSADNTRVQIDVYASTPAVADSIAATVVDAMQAAANAGVFGSYLITSPRDEPDPDTRLFRLLLEFSVWS
jgi:hypothetical protein